MRSIRPNVSICLVLVLVTVLFFVFCFYFRPKMVSEPFRDPRGAKSDELNLVLFFPVFCFNLPAVEAKRIVGNETLSGTEREKATN